MQRTQQLGILGTIPREKEVKLSLELLDNMNDAYSEVFVPMLVFNQDKFRQKVIRSKEILKEML